MSANPVRIPWPLPPPWRWARMSDVAEIVGGGTPKTERTDYFGGDTPWITPADLSGYKQKTIARGSRNITQAGLENSGARLMPAGSVLFSSRAPIGYVAVAANPVSTNQGFKSFILRDGMLSDYVYYWLQVAKKFAIEMASGTTFLEISGKKAAEIPIPVAPIDEQRRIVAELETQLTRLDASVDALKRAQANLKRYRASILKAACEGRLVPTEAELARVGNRPYESGANLLVRLLKERRAKWTGRRRYSEPNVAEIVPLTMLPEGWCWASPGQISAPEDYSLAIGPFGSNLKVSDYKDSGVPLVFVRNIRANSYDMDKAKCVSAGKALELNAHSVKGGDVLITKMGDPPGDASLYPEHAPQAIITADCIKFRLSPSLPAPSYFVHAANSEVMRAQMRRITRGVAQQKVSLAGFAGVAFPLPPVAEQVRIVAEIERRFSVIEELESTVDTNLKRTERLRQSVLVHAFSSPV